MARTVDTPHGLGEAERLIAAGVSDEEVERRSGANLTEIIALRAAHAAGSSPRRSKADRESPPESR